MFYFAVISLTLHVVSTVLGRSTESARIHYSHKFNGCSLPNILPVTISIRGENITSNLTKNNDVPSSFPVYNISESGRGKSVLKLDIPHDKDGVAYQDKVALIAVVIKCKEVENNKTVLEMLGSMSFHGKEFAIHRSHRVKREAEVSSDEDEEEEYTLEELKPLSRQINDAIKARPSTTNIIMKEMKVDRKPNILSRHKRDLVHYFVDIVMLVDYSIYKYWYLRSTALNRRTDAIKNIRLYYAIVANGINLRYKNLQAEFGITVKLSGLIIAETTSTSSWTENIVERSSPRDQVNADLVLENLRDWVATTDTLPAYDHIMLFTRYDLYSLQSNIKYNSTAGLAYIGAVCDTSGQATSIVEDEGGYQSIETAAHELGHSLGARHDGRNPACSDADRYIMTQGAAVFSEATQLNPWKFSKCSVDYFRTALKQIARTSRGYQCLSKTLTANNIPNVEDIMPGQITPPDETCRQIFGPSSRMCKGIEFGNVSQICVSLFCLDPTTTSSCIKQTAPRGTSCGDKKWCIDGQCVHDNKAPVLDESCPFGDVSGIAFNGRTCQSGVSDYPAFCYQDVIAGRCCSSCNKYYTGVYGCEYGDKGSGCVTRGCGFQDTNGGNYSATCCGTCNYRIDTPKPSTTPQTIPTKQPACVDSSPSFLLGSSCYEFISVSPEACYISSVLNSCCDSCNRIKSQNYYCPYGNKGSECESSRCGTVFSPGEYYDSLCCSTCNYTGGIPGASTNKPSTTTTPTTTTPATTTPTTTTPTTTTPSTTTPTTTTPTTTTPTTTTPTTTTPTTTSTTTTTPTTTTPITTTPTTTTTTTTTPSTTTRTPTTPTTAAPTTTMPITTARKSSASPPTTTPPSINDTTFTTPSSSPCQELTADQRTVCTDYLLEKGSHVCYNSEIESKCCPFCYTIRNNNSPDCPYGDRSPVDCKARLEKGESCNTVTMAQECCQSCVSTGQSAISASLLTLIIVLATSFVFTSDSCL